MTLQKCKPSSVEERGKRSYTTAYALQVVPALLPAVQSDQWQAQEAAVAVIKVLIRQVGSAVQPWLSALLPGLVQAACCSKPQVTLLPLYLHQHQDSALDSQCWCLPPSTGLSEACLCGLSICAALSFGMMSRQLYAADHPMQLVNVQLFCVSCLSKNVLVL